MHLWVHHVYSHAGYAVNECVDAAASVGAIEPSSDPKDEWRWPGDKIPATRLSGKNVSVLNEFVKVCVTPVYVFCRLGTRGIFFQLSSLWSLFVVVCSVASFLHLHASACMTAVMRFVVHRARLDQQPCVLIRIAFGVDNRFKSFNACVLEGVGTCRSVRYQQRCRRPFLGGARASRSQL